MIFELNGMKNRCDHKILSFFTFSAYHIQIADFGLLGLYNCLFFASYHVLGYCDLYPLCPFVNDKMIGAKFFHNFDKFRDSQVIGRIGLGGLGKL